MVTTTETRRYSMLLYGYRLEEDENEEETDVGEPNMPPLPFINYKVTDLELAAYNFMYHEEGDLRHAFGDVYFGIGQRLYVDESTKVAEFHVPTEGEQVAIESQIREFLVEHDIEYDPRNLTFWHFVGWE